MRTPALEKNGVASILTVTGKIRCMHVRAGTPSDAPAIARIQAAAPQAAQWDISGYPLLVAEHDGCVAGFLIWCETGPGEVEILNLAVDPGFRRLGAASALVAAVPSATIFLEVRESNRAARALYRKAGFTKTGVRTAYYHNPLESAIVMTLKR